MSSSQKEFLGGTGAFVGLCLVVFGLVVLGFQGCGMAKDWSRHQKLKTTANNVKVTEINVKKAHQRARITKAEIEITKAEAEKKYQESIGIKRAQDEISKTLTPEYLQHEAIQAQRVQGEGDKIYIPVGNQGIPIVNNVGGK